MLLSRDYTKHRDETRNPNFSSFLYLPFTHVAQSVKETCLWYYVSHETIDVLHNERLAARNEDFELLHSIKFPVEYRHPQRPLHLRQWCPIAPINAGVGRNAVFTTQIIPLPDQKLDCTSGRNNWILDWMLYCRQPSPLIVPMEPSYGPWWLQEHHWLGCSIAAIAILFKPSSLWSFWSVELRSETGQLESEPV